MTVRVGLVVHGHVDFDEGVRLVRDVARRQPQHVGRDEEAERAVAAGADAVDADRLVDIVGRLGVGDIAVALAEVREIPGEVGDQFLEVGLHRTVLGPEPVERRVGRLGPVLQLQELLHLLLDLGLPGDGANRLRGQVGGGERVGDGAVEVGTIGSHAVAQVYARALTTADVVVVGTILVEVDFEAGPVGVVVDDVGVGRDRGNRRVDLGRDNHAHPEPPLEDVRVVGRAGGEDFDLGSVVDVHGVRVGARAVVVERVLRRPALERHQRRVENFVNRDVAVGPPGIGLGPRRLARLDGRRVLAVRIAVVIAVIVARVCVFVVLAQVVRAVIVGVSVLVAEVRGVEAALVVLLGVVVLPAVRHSVLVAVGGEGVGVPRELPVIGELVTIGVGAVVGDVARVETVIYLPAISSTAAVGIGIVGVGVVVVLLEVGVHFLGRDFTVAVGVVAVIIVVLVTVRVIRVRAENRQRRQRREQHH